MVVGSVKPSEDSSMEHMQNKTNTNSGRKWEKQEDNPPQEMTKHSKETQKIPNEKLLQHTHELT